MIEPPLIAARCTRCFRLAAKYWVIDGEAMWFESRRMFGKVCRCDPAPVLPDGADLDELLARARREPSVSLYRAPFEIRV